MSKVKEIDYLYITALVWAREPKLLGKQRLSRMLEANAPGAALSVLSECGYGELSEASGAGVRTMLEKRRAEAFSELAELAPDEEIVDLFRLKYDYHNAKVLIKAEAADTDGKRLLAPAGRIAPERFCELYYGGRFDQIPFGAALSAAKEALARTGDAQQADFILDRSYFEEFSKTAAASKNQFLLSWSKLLIDSANLRGTVRTLRMGRDTGFLKGALIPGGNVPAEAVLRAAGGEASLTALFSETRLKKAAQCAEKVLSGGSPGQLEKSCDEAVYALMSETRGRSYGVEPLVSYLFTLEEELSIVRAIITGLISGSVPEVLRERVRDLY